MTPGTQQKLGGLTVKVFVESWVLTDHSEKPKSKRGFASMTPERRQEIARMGGASIPSAKRSFSVNRELAVSAGRTGGQAKKESQDVASAGELSSKSQKTLSNKPAGSPEGK